MEAGKPDSLAEVWTLAGTLVVEPLNGVILLGSGGGEGEFVVFVVGLDEVLDYRARFPECDVCVWVVDGGDTGGEKELFSDIASYGLRGKGRRNGTRWNWEVR